MTQWVRSLDLTAHTSLSPMRRGLAPSFVIYKKGCIRLAAASDNVYYLFAHGQWFFPGTSAFSTTKIGRHDIAEILLKVALKHQKNQSINLIYTIYHQVCIKRCRMGATYGEGTDYLSGRTLVHSRLLVGFVLFDVLFCV